MTPEEQLWRAVIVQLVKDGTSGGVAEKHDAVQYLLEPAYHNYRETVFGYAGMDVDWMRDRILTLIYAYNKTVARGVRPGKEPGTTRFRWLDASRSERKAAIDFLDSDMGRRLRSIYISAHGVEPTRNDLQAAYVVAHEAA